MGNKTPLLPIRRNSADVIPLAQRRRDRFDALNTEAQALAQRAPDTAEAQAAAHRARLYTPLTEADIAAARRAVYKQPPLMDVVEVAVSNNDLVFKALHAGLIRAQRGKLITTFGATLGSSETQSDSGYWERPASLSFGDITYQVTMLSNGWPSNINVPDTDFPDRKRDECIMLLETEGGTKFYVYADRVKGVPQINNSRYWRVYCNLGQGDTSIWDFKSFLNQHHPAMRGAVEIDKAVDAPAVDPEIKGYSIGDHKGRSARGGHMMIIGGTTMDDDDEDEDEDEEVEEKPKPRRRKPRRKTDPNHVCLGAEVAKRATGKNAEKKPAKNKPGVRMHARIKGQIKKRQTATIAKGAVRKQVGRANIQPQRSVTRRARRRPRPEDNM